MTIINQTIYNGSSFLITFFATLIPIILFAVGLLIKIYQHNSGVKREHKKQLQFFKKLLEKSFEYINKMKTDIEKFSNEVQSNPYDVILPQRLVNESLKRLCNYDYRPFFNAYTILLSKTPDDFIKLYNSLDFFNLRFQQIFDQNEKHVHNKNKDQWYIKENLDSIYFTISDIIDFSLESDLSLEALTIADYFRKNYDHLTSANNDQQDQLFEQFALLTEKTCFDLDKLVRDNSSSISPHALSLLSKFRDIDLRFKHMSHNSKHFAKEITLDNKIDLPHTIISDSITELKRFN